MTDEILAAQGLKSPAWRDFAIAGMKVLAPRKAEDHLMRGDLGEHDRASVRQRARI
jgi:hypothetical protein